MQNCKNEILQQFLEKLIQTIEDEREEFYSYSNENSLITKEQIPFIVAPLWQAFKSEPNTYQEFISDLSKYTDYQIHITRPTNDYYGICDFQIILLKGDWKNCEEPNYNYLIEIYEDMREWGYCECSSTDPDYREDKHCCGHGCDWSAPSFSLHKIVDINKHEWIGDEHDFWNFEDGFYKDEKSKNGIELLHKLLGIKDWRKNNER